MKILIIHSGYPINNSAGEGVRTNNMAKSLTDMGHSVTVLLLYSIINFRLKNLKFIKYSDGIRYICIPTFPNSRLLSIALLYNQIIVWIISKLTKAEAIQAEITWSASTAGFIKKIPLITDFHSDLVPELKHLNLSAAFIEKSKRDNVYALKNSKYILCVSKTLHNNLSNTYGVSSPLNLLPCNVDFNLFTKDRLVARDRLRTELNLDGKIVLSYLGGAQRWQCLNETLDIFIRLKALDSRYYLCIFTNDNLRPYAEKMGTIKDSSMVKGLNRSNLVEYLSIIDAGFVLREDLLLNANSSPTKTGEYMAVGAMVIATINSGDAPDLINESGYGYVLSGLAPSEDELIKLNQSINNFIENGDINRPKVRNYIEYARDWARNHDKLKMLYSNLDKKSKCED